MDNTKSGEIHQKASEATQPALCKANCGFFGAADKQGYCSVSFGQKNIFFNDQHFWRIFRIHI